jgi:hypothetical protein
MIDELLSLIERPGNNEQVSLNGETQILHEEQSKLQLFFFTETRSSVLIIGIAKKVIGTANAVVDGTMDVIMDIGDVIVIHKR